MKYFSGFILALGLLSASLHAQTLTVSFGADSLKKQVGEQLQSTITITPPNGFTASIFLKISSPTLSVTSKDLSDSIVNAPYPKTIQLSHNVTFRDSGIHQVIIEGKNGNLVAYDTLHVEIIRTEQWRILGMRNTTAGQLYFNPVDNYYHPTMDETRPVVKVTKDSVSAIKGWEGMKKPHGVIAQDTNSNIWISAVGGIGMYDGNYWTYYPNQPNLVTSKMLFDKNGSLLFSTYIPVASWRDEHLLSFKNGVITQYDDKITSLLPDFNSSYGINDICRDSSGNVWILASASMKSSVKTIIIKYDGVNWSTLNYPDIGLAYTNDAHGLSKIAFDNNGNMWIWYDVTDSTGKEINGLLQYNGATWDEFRCNEDYSIYWNHWLYTDNSGGIWFINDFPRSLVHFDGNNFREYNSSNSPLPEAKGSIITIDSNDNIWLAWGVNTVVFNPIGITGVKISTDIMENQEQLHKVFKTTASPNPTQNSTTIHYSLKTESPVAISIYNSLGIEVFKSALGFKNAGENSEIISTSELPSGQYYYVLKAGAQQSTQPLVIVR